MKQKGALMVALLALCLVLWAIVVVIKRQATSSVLQPSNPTTLPVLPTKTAPIIQPNRPSIDQPLPVKAHLRPVEPSPKVTPEPLLIQMADTASTQTLEYELPSKPVQADELLFDDDTLPPITRPNINQGEVTITPYISPL